MLHQIGAPGPSALFAVDMGCLLETNVEEMTEAAPGREDRRGHLGHPRRPGDAEGNPIAEGDVIGIADGSIEAVDDSIDGAVLTLLGKMDAEDRYLQPFWPARAIPDEDLRRFVAKIEEASMTSWKWTPSAASSLYPIVFSVE